MESGVYPKCAWNINYTLHKIIPWYGWYKWYEWDEWNECNEGYKEYGGFKINEEFKGLTPGPFYTSGV